VLSLRKLLIPLWYKLEKAQVVAEEELKEIKNLDRTTQDESLKW